MRSPLFRFFARRAAAPVAPAANFLRAPTMSWNLSDKNPVAIRCETLMSETVASLPLVEYQKTANGRKKAGWTAEYSVVKNTPNPYETPAVFYSSLMHSLTRRGNAYVQPQWDGLNLVAMYLLDPDQMRIDLDGARRTYLYAGQPMSDVIHIPSPLGYDGVYGQSVMDYARAAISLSNKASDYLGHYLDNSLFTKLKMGVPIDLTAFDDKAKAQIKQLQDMVKATMGGDRTGNPLILPNGVTAETIDLASNRDSELAAQREIQDRVIAYCYGVPWALISGDAKYDSLETQNMHFLTYTLMPYLRRIEQAFSKLLPASQRDTLYFEFSYETLLRPDTQTRYAVYQTAISNGLMSINEARDRENMDSLGPEGDVHFVQALMPLRMDVINAYMSGAKIKQIEVEQGLDNKAK